MDIQRHSVWLPIQRGYFTNPFKIHFRPQLLLFYIVLILFFSQNCFATLYRCTDENGRKIFSDTPCMQGTTSTGTIDEANTPHKSNDNINTENVKKLPEGVIPVVITGRVTFSNGDPISGVEVLSWARQNKKTGFKGMTTSKTDANGYYKLNIDNRYLWVVYHHGTERQEFSRKGPWQNNTTVDFIVPAK